MVCMRRREPVQQRMPAARLLAILLAAYMTLRCTRACVRERRDRQSRQAVPPHPKGSKDGNLQDSLANRPYTAAAGAEKTAAEPLVVGACV